MKWEHGNNPERGVPGEKAKARETERNEKAEARRQAAEDAKNEALKAIEQAKLNRNLDEIEIERLEAIARFSIAQLLAKGKK